MDPLARGDLSAGRARHRFGELLGLGELVLQATETRRHADLPVPNVRQRRLENFETAPPLVPLLDIG
jgi:hypothetical protein